MTRDEAAREIDNTACCFSDKRFRDAMHMAAAALRGPQPDPETGLVPELVRFIKQVHPDVEIIKPKLNMKQLIVKNLYPPTRTIRYCCKTLKECSGKHRVTVTGVRWAESPRRKANHGVASVDRLVLNDDNDESRRMVESCYRTTKTLVNPIIDWTDEDVWEFIKLRNLPYCSLYDEWLKRLGCVGCPMAGRKQREIEFARWPQYERYYKSAFAEMIEARKAKGKNIICGTADGVFDWWMERTGKQAKKEQVLFTDKESNNE